MLDKYKLTLVLSSSWIDSLFFTVFHFLLWYILNYSLFYANTCSLDSFDLQEESICIKIVLDRKLFTIDIVTIFSLSCFWCLVFGFFDFWLQYFSSFAWTYFVLSIFLKNKASPTCKSLHLVLSYNFKLLMSLITTPSLLNLLTRF